MHAQPYALPTPITAGGQPYQLFGSLENPRLRGRRHTLVVLGLSLIHILDRFGVDFGEAAGVADARDADEVSDQPVRHAARLHRLLILLNRHPHIGDLAAQHLRKHIGKITIVGRRTGELVALAGMRRRDVYKRQKTTSVWRRPRKRGFSSDPKS